MDIKILEQICWGGSTVAPIVDGALTDLNLDDDFEVISDIPTIAEYGVNKLPALVINGKIRFEGKTPSLDEVKSILKEEL